MHIPPALLVVAICACVVFPPLLLAVIPLIIVLTVTKKGQMQRTENLRAQLVREERRAKAIRGFMSA